MEKNLLGTRDCDDESDFDDWCRAIAKEYSMRLWRISPSDKVQGRKEVRSWLRHVCYQFVDSLVRQDGTHFIQHRTDSVRKEKRGRCGDPNMFQQALKAIFAHQPDLISTGECHRVGAQLMFAYRHYVPLPFLDAFLVFTSALHSKPENAKVIAPHFEAWVIRQRAKANGTSCLRGVYPSAISLAVTKRTKKKRATLKVRPYNWD